MIVFVKTSAITVCRDLCNDCVCKDLCNNCLLRLCNNCLQRRAIIVFAEICAMIVCRDLAVELPFTLTHPKPVETPPPTRTPSMVPVEPGESPVDTNLIQFDTK